MSEEKFTFFLKKQPLTQWTRSTFTVDGVTYNSAEQYMMAEKARFFGDQDTLQEIMKADHPREQKAWGRKVKGYDDQKWAEAARAVVYRGNHAKFTQNPEMLERLFATAGTTLVECNPEDSRWVIGLAIDDERRLDRKTWQG